MDQWLVDCSREPWFQLASPCLHSCARILTASVRLSRTQAREKPTMRRILTILLSFVVVAGILPICASPRPAAAPNELLGAFRLPEKNGWTYVHLQGTPREIGFQNGYLLAPEID